MNHRLQVGTGLGILFVLLFILLLDPGSAAVPAALPAGSSVGEALWKGRTFEVILQGIMILSGVMSIILLLRSGRGRGGPP